MEDQTAQDLSMATILLHRPIGFPIPILRELLRLHVPAYGWQVGENDLGGKQDTDTLERPQTIIGRSRDGAPLLVSVEFKPQHFDPGDSSTPPEHRYHVLIRPRTDDPELALRLRMIVAAGLVSQNQDPDCRIGFGPGLAWCDDGDMRTAIILLRNDGDLGLLLRPDTGEPAALAAPIPAALPTTLAPPNEPGAKREAERLGSFTFLLDSDVHIDWNLIGEAMNAVDPGGNWMPVAVPAGLGFIHGRSKIVSIWSPTNYEWEPIADAVRRSHWFDGDLARIGRHTRYITLQIDAPEAFADKVATAKAATILVGLVTKLPQVCAVFNNMVSTLFSPAMVHDQVCILHQDEVPIQLWTWMAPNSLAEGDISITSGGLEPFLGYEVEVWNAPQGRELVIEKLNGVLRYLLINGPVIRHGETIGAAPGDRSTRCFFGPSRAERERPVEAMFLEFETEAGAAPRPDPVPTPAPKPDPTPYRAEEARPSAIRRAVFGRRGL
jgi:hypothetical protein